MDCSLSTGGRRFGATGRALLFFLLLWTASFASADDALIVTRPMFADSLAEWISYRESQGWRIHTLLAEPESPDRPLVAPETVRRQIRSLAAVYPISTLLIVGDGAPESDTESDWEAVLPAPRVETGVIHRFGPERHIASDSWYADLDDDGFPELAVGRIPARNPSDMAAATRKIIRYEMETAAGRWQSDVRFIAGVGGFSPILDSVIQRSVRSMLADLLPDAMTLTFTQADWKSLYCPDPTLFRFLTLDQINAGPLFWIYAGHGDYDALDRLQTPAGDFRILERGDAERIDVRNSAPILLFFACYAGAYDARQTSMAEAAFLRPNGPVAVLASSRTAMPYGMAVFGAELLGETFSSQPATLGAMVLAAKRRMRTEFSQNAASTGEIEAGEIEQEEAEREKNGSKKIDSEEAESNEAVRGAVVSSDSAAKRIDVRRRIDATARIFDPAADALPAERRDHIHLFNLFGDPLLSVRLPQWFEIDSPATVRAAQTVTVTSESVGADGPVRVELVLPLTRQTVRIAPRREFSLSDEERIRYQRTYEGANQRVAAAADGIVKNGRFSVDLPIPEPLYGRYVLRAVLSDGETLRLASRPIRVQKQDSPPSEARTKERGGTPRQ